jgi:hypothetical protein
MGFALGAGCVAILLRDTQPEKDEFSMHPPACYFGGGLKLLDFVRALEVVHS